MSIARSVELLCRLTLPAMSLMSCYVRTALDRLLRCLHKSRQLQALDEALPLEILICAPVIYIALSVLKLFLHLCFKSSQLSFLHTQQSPSVHRSFCLRSKVGLLMLTSLAYCVEYQSLEGS